jgi:uncharacterized membrane protein
MSTALFVVGLVIMLIGLGLIVFAKKPETEKKGPAARGLDPEKILEQVNKLLAQVDKRYRIGLAVMLMGLALVGIGAFLEAKDAKDAAKGAKAGQALLTGSLT